MKKEHLKVVKDAVKSLGEIDGKFDNLVTEAVAEIDKQIENLGNLADSLQAEFDEMGEKAQEGDKGTALEELIESISEAKSDLEDLKDELDSSPSEDVISKLEEIENK